MKIAVVGLGLIGGSFAKAMKQNTEHTVYGYDISESVMRKAELLEAIDARLTAEALGSCEIVIIALYPTDTVAYIRAHAAEFGKGAIVIDTCGVKEAVVSQAEPIAAEYGFTFLGGHPMAGTEYSGFEYSKKALFEKASMILTPSARITIEDLEKAKRFCLSLGFGSIQIATPQSHDRMIAFTSQLAHVVSSAYVKSEAALRHRGFSAGSFRDMTRVAYLNETMWTELFLDNTAYLADEIDGLITRLGEYSDAIRNGKRDELMRLLREGRERKVYLENEENKP